MARSELQQGAREGTVADACDEAKIHPSPAWRQRRSRQKTLLTDGHQRVQARLIIKERPFFENYPLQIADQRGESEAMWGQLPDSRIFRQYSA